MGTFLAAAFFLLGAVVGSFLNVVIHRLPRRESVVFPPSACPGCGAGIRPWDNVPILSFLWLRGRCRACGAAISPRYPVVELLTALCTTALFLLAGPSLSLAIYLPFTWALIALAFIDAEHQILPDRITYPGIALSLLVPLLGSLADISWGEMQVRPGWSDWIAGVILGAGIPYLVIEGYWLAQFRKPPGERIEGMGFGDVKMLAMVGGFLGWKLVLLTVMIGAVLGSVWGLAGIAVSRYGMKHPLPFGMSVPRYGMKHALPFGTFLAVGAFAALTVGPILLDWYAALSGFGS